MLVVMRVLCGGVMMAVLSMMRMHNWIKLLMLTFGAMMMGYMLTSVMALTSMLVATITTLCGGRGACVIITITIDHVSFTAVDSGTSSSVRTRSGWHWRLERVLRDSCSAGQLERWNC